MKMIIAGGRNYHLNEDDIGVLNHIDITEVVSGGAPGADRCGEMYAQSKNIPIKKFPAAAGPIRNRQMAEYADAVFLFPGGHRTESMRKEAIKANIFIYTQETGE